MNCEMWEKAAVQRNVQQLRADGVHFVDPEEGWLSCRKRGVGRMAAPERIIAAIQALLKVRVRSLRARQKHGADSHHFWTDAAAS